MKNASRQRRARNRASQDYVDGLRYVFWHWAKGLWLRFPMKGWR